MGLKRVINNWILGKAIEHLGREKVFYKSTLHNKFREDGVKTIGRFDIMLCLLLVIQSKTRKFLGIKKIEIDENSELILIRIELNKITHLVIYKEEIEDELSKMVKKIVVLDLKFTNKLFGLDFYSVI